MDSGNRNIEQGYDLFPQKKSTISTDSQTCNENSLVEGESFNDELTLTGQDDAFQEGIKPTPNYSKAISLFVSLLVTAGIGFGAYAYFNSKDIQLAKVSAAQNSQYLTQVSLAELALHSSADDCWLEIHGNVYDLTDYANQHPGGVNVITSLAGTRATSAYALHHNQRLLDTIPSTLIGTLIEEGTNTTILSGTNTTILTGIPLTEIALHRYEYDLWAAIHGNVYNLTAYAQVHPGGASFIISIAGTNATDVFDSFHPINFLPLIERHIIGVLSTNETSVAPSQSEVSAPRPTASPPSKPTVPLTATIRPTNKEDSKCWVRLITIDEVNDHEVDRWVVFYDNVYDLSNYDHPGGVYYMKMAAGTDATSHFEKHHSKSLLTNSRVGVQELMIGRLSSVSGLLNDCLGGMPVSTPTLTPTLVPTVSTPTTIRPSSTQEANCFVRLITIEEVQAHINDKWVVFYDEVFDLSTYNHPGGYTYIDLAAGTEATNFFERQHVRSYINDTNKGIERFKIGRLSTKAGLVNICNGSDQFTPTPTPTSVPSLSRPTTVRPTNQQESNCLLRLFTIEEVAAHADMLWVVFYDQVYDLSTYTHPGGNYFIKQAAGIDGTALFEVQHYQSYLTDPSKGVQSLLIGQLSTRSGLVNIC